MNIDNEQKCITLLYVPMPLSHDAVAPGHKSAGVRFPALGEYI